MSGKTTRKALFGSVLALVLCVAMLVGSTFAWFTDSVTSGENKIQSGTLTVDLELLDKGTNTWDSIKDSKVPIFSYDKWEPGYTDVKIFKIENEGTLALKWVAKFVSDSTLSDLANVIDVYVRPYGVLADDSIVSYPANRNLDGYTKVGTVAEFVNTIEETTYGNLKANEVAYLGIALKMQESAGNEYQNLTLGAFDIQIFATQDTVEYDSFNNQYDSGALFEGTLVTPENIATIDFTAENAKYIFSGNYGDVTIPEIGKDSVLDLGDATFGTMTLSDDAVLTGTATINNLQVKRNSTEPIALTIEDGNLDITGELGVRNTEGKSVLNVNNSNVYFGTIYVGEHVNNEQAALAEFNVINSFLSGEENGLGSTINVWGRSGAKATIYDSEIYTYSRGWHQSEDANDNAITIQGATNLELDIQRSNMHLYGARSIINLRQYGSEETTKTAKIDESLIWVVTKSSHSENTIPVWGVEESNINDSILLFTKNVYQSTPAVFKSFVYGNPVIYGDYHVTTQCQWNAPIALADGQTVTFAEDANVSIYDGAGKVEFVKTGSAKVVVEDCAVVKNIGGIN